MPFDTASKPSCSGLFGCWLCSDDSAGSLSIAISWGSSASGFGSPGSGSPYREISTSSCFAGWGDYYMIYIPEVYLTASHSTGKTPTKFTTFI